MAYTIAFFGTKPYDESSFNDKNKEFGFEIRYYKGHLNKNNVLLTQGVDAVCIFVNDVADAEVIRVMAANGVKLLALRCAGFNNVDLDAAAAAGDEVPAVKGGRVSVVEDDALWGGVVEIVDANGCTWRYCGVTPSCVVGGDAAAGDVIGVVAAIPAEADLASHVHLECLKDGAWMKPEI